MGDWARDNDSGGSDFDEAELNRVVCELEKHRGKANAVKLVDFASKVGLPHEGRTLRAIWRHLASHPELGVVKCSNGKGGIFAGATVREILDEAEMYERMGRSCFDHGSNLRRHAARHAAVQPAMFDMGVTGW